MTEFMHKKIICSHGQDYRIMIHLSIVSFEMYLWYWNIKAPSRLTSNSTWNSYLSKLCMHQHVPNHLVPSLFDSKRNQSVPESLLFWTYCEQKANEVERAMKNQNKISTDIGSTLIRAWYSSFNRCTQSSLSRGPAFVCNKGMPLSVFRVLASTILSFFTRLFSFF